MDVFTAAKLIGPRPTRPTPWLRHCLEGKNYDRFTSTLWEFTSIYSMRFRVLALDQSDHSICYNYNNETCNTDDLYQVSCAHEQGHSRWAWPRWATTDGIYDAHGPSQTIQSVFKPVYSRFRLIGYAYKLHRLLDFEIWRFSWWRRTDTLYCACARDINTCECRAPCTVSFSPILL